MIQIKSLKASAIGKEILKGIYLDLEIGKNYCLLGKNGSGKSTLSSILMGSPEYKIDEGEIKITSPSIPLLNEREGNPPSHGGEGARGGGIDLLKLSPEERSKAGLFLSFQNVPEIPGIKISEYLRTIYNIHINNPSPVGDNHGPSQPSLKSKGRGLKELSPFVFKRFIKKYLTELDIDEKILDRDLNVGFSGGEKRKIEILQMKLIGPKYIILDEIDSGLDLDAFKKVAELLQSINTKDNSIIIITHYFNILDYIDVDEVYIMKNGLIEQKGGKELIDKVKENGYK